MPCIGAKRLDGCRTADQLLAEIIEIFFREGCIFCGVLNFRFEDKPAGQTGPFETAYGVMPNIGRHKGILTALNGDDGTVFGFIGNRTVADKDQFEAAVSVVAKLHGMCVSMHTHVFKQRHIDVGAVDPDLVMRCLCHACTLFCIDVFSKANMTMRLVVYNILHRRLSKDEAVLVRYSAGSILEQMCPWT